jgi:hypothetical protein
MLAPKSAQQNRQNHLNSKEEENDDDDDEEFVTSSDETNNTICSPNLRDFCTRCALGCVQKPEHGSTVFILMNVLFTALIFLCSFAIFNVPETRAARRLVDSLLYGEGYDDISDPKSYLTWFDNFLSKDIKHTMIDYNGQSVGNFVEMKAIKPLGISFEQIRTASVPSCSDPLNGVAKDGTNDVVTRFHRVQKYLGIDCAKEKEKDYGQILSLKNVSYDPMLRASYKVIECPSFTSPRFVDNQPFKMIKLVGDIDGYKYQIKGMPSLMAAKGLLQCNWIDLNTKIARTRSAFLITASGFVGTVTIEASFQGMFFFY